MKRLLMTAALIGLFSSAFTTILSAETKVLYAGQDYDIGTVEIWNDASNIYVDVSLNEADITAGWCITETHVHIDSLSDFPVTRSGNPKIGHFEYSMGYECVTEIDPIVISLGDLIVGDSANMAVHVSLEQVVDGIVYMDSAWAEGTRFNERGNWATYFGYTVEPCTLVLDIAEVNNNENFWHYYVINYDFGGNILSSTGEYVGGHETLSGIVIDKIAGTVTYTSVYGPGNGQPGQNPGYTYTATIILNPDGTLTLQSGTGGVASVTGTWSDSCSE